MKMMLAEPMKTELMKTMPRLMIPTASTTLNCPARTAVEKHSPMTRHYLVPKRIAWPGMMHLMSPGSMNWR